MKTETEILSITSGAIQLASGEMKKKSPLNSWNKIHSKSQNELLMGFFR